MRELTDAELAVLTTTAIGMTQVAAADPAAARTPEPKEKIMTDPSKTLTGVALLSTEPPTGLRVTYARIPTGDLPRIRAALDRARTAALGLAPGEWADLTVVVGRHDGGRPRPEGLTARPEDVESLRTLVLELDR